MAERSPAADVASQPPFEATVAAAADPVVARVIAWHNKHPLAWHIDARHVVSVGHVWLPFEAPPSAVPGGHRRGWKAAFSENFIAPLRSGRVARWALKHGWQAQTDGATAGAVRVVDATARQQDRPLETLWLATAAIELGATRRRVLIGHADDMARAPVLGPRVWRRRRVAGVLATSSAVAGAAVAVLAMQLMPLLRPTEPATLMAAAPVASSAAPAASSAVPVVSSPASAASSVAPAASAATEVVVAVAAGGAASAVPTPVPTPLQTPVPAGAAPLPPAQGNVPSAAESRRPQLVAKLDDGSKAAAREALAAARAARDEQRRAQGLPPLPPPGAASAATPPPPPPTLIAQAAAAPQTWALTSRVLRTRAESERLLLALRAAGNATKPAEKSQQLVFEVLPVGADWRAVGYPFATRREAERARDLLAARGVNVEVAAF